MIIDKAIQGTKEWREARGGIPTASAFDMIITTSGTPSKQKQKYLYSLAAERITGVSEDKYQNDAMKRGIEMEAEARAMYELVTGNTVEVVGVCYPDKKKLYGCSPDGLVGADGVLEIKCPTAPIHVGYLFNGGLPTDYYCQVQGQLLVTGRKYVDFFSYFPGLAPLLVSVKPDEKFQKALRVELEIFVKELDEITERLKRI